MGVSYATPMTRSLGAQCTFSLFHAAAETDWYPVLGPRHLPRIAEAEPLVRLLHLPAVLQLLIEHPELVADAVAVSGHVERGHRVEKARREPAEAAVAEPGVDLLLHQVGDLEPHHAHRLAPDLVQAEVEQVVGERPAHEEFRREVVDALRVAPVVALLRGDPALDEAVAHGQRQRHETVARGRGVLVLRERIEKVIGERVQDRRRLVRCGSA